MVFERAASLSDLEVGSPTMVKLAGEPICLVRTDETTVKAVHNTCSHAQYDLHEGWLESRADGGWAIECALHGSMFDLDTGHPDALPAVKPIPTYAVHVDGDDVLVDAATPTNSALPPRH